MGGRFGTNHSLDRDHNRHHPHAGGGHHHHHHSLDRESTNSLARGGHTHGRPVFNTTAATTNSATKSRSSASNTSLAMSISNAHHSSEEHLHNGHAPAPQKRKSLADSTSLDYEGGVTGNQMRNSSSRAKMKPPKDPKSHHHHHQHHHSRHKINDDRTGSDRKRSLGNAEDGGRKMSGAGSVSSMLSDVSMTSFSNGNGRRGLCADPMTQS